MKCPTVGFAKKVIQVTVTDAKMQNTYYDLFAFRERVIERISPRALVFSPRHFLERTRLPLVFRMISGFFFFSSSLRPAVLAGRESRTATLNLHVKP